MKDNTVNRDELLPEGNSLELYNRLQDFASESSILIVGHEPYLTNIIDDIISQQRSKGRRSRLVTNGTRVKGIVRPERSIVVKRGGLAKIRIISTTPELRGELRWLLTPRILKSLFEESYTVEKTGQKKGKSGD